MATIYTKLLLVFLTYFYARFINCTTLYSSCKKHGIYNPTQMGKLLHGRCQQHNIIMRLSHKSLLECVKQCHLTSQCTSINYRHEWNLCDINGQSTEGLSEEDRCVYSNITSWPQKDARTCDRQFCDSLPESPNSTFVEKFGLFRNVGYRIKCKCNVGFVMAGQPYSVCQRSGVWTNMFSCVHQHRFPAVPGYVFSNRFNSCYKLHEINTSLQRIDYNDVCVAEGSELMKIDSEEKQQHVISFLDQFALSTWIMFQGTHVVSEVPWRYNDGSVISYFNWDSSQSQPDSSTAHSLEYFATKKEYNYKWHDVWPSYKGAFLCERLL